MKRVAILGHGPAGLLSAYAAHLQRVDCDILSTGKESVISGAQFLHAEIPLLTGTPDGMFELHKQGTAAGYAEKVYGDPNAPCSWDLMQVGQHHAWSLRDAYDTLQGMFGDQVEQLHIDHDLAAWLAKRYDLVISTIPRWCICNGDHTFSKQRVFFKDGACVSGVDGNFIVYNGDPEIPWYRSSKLFGVEQTEYGDDGSFLADEIDRAGDKPLHTDCTCNPNIKCVGRFGKWEKGVLVHHAFQEAMDALQQL